MTRVLIPAGALGISFDRGALLAGARNKPDILAIDGGSTDSGPAYLGKGVSKYSAAATKADWAELLAAREIAGAPLVIGTAGTCGADATVDWLLELTRQIAEERGLTLKVAALYSSQPIERVASAHARGALQPLPAAPDVTEETIRSCANIVALAGAEQIQEALKTGADVVIAGRTTDTATIAALPLLRGDHPGGAWHGAKIGECGALATSQPQTGVIQIDFDKTGFTVTPLAPEARATPRSVSAHMLYENADPYILHEPGGFLDVRRARYAALDDRSVRVEGSVWETAPYAVKLEGARVAGFQAVSFVMVRERRYVENIEAWARDIQAQCEAKAIALLALDPQDFTIDLRVVGLNAVLGDLEARRGRPSEVGVLSVVTAKTAALASDIAKMLNPYLLHHPLTDEEPMPTFAFPFSPAETMRGEVYEFCLHHVLPLAKPMDAFRLETMEFRYG